MDINFNYKFILKNRILLIANMVLSLLVWPVIVGFIFIFGIGYDGLQNVGTNISGSDFSYLMIFGSLLVVIIPLLYFFIQLKTYRVFKNYNKTFISKFIVVVGFWFPFLMIGLISILFFGLNQFKKQNLREYFDLKLEIMREKNYSNINKLSAKYDKLVNKKNKNNQNNNLVNPNQN